MSPIQVNFASGEDQYKHLVAIIGKGIQVPRLFNEASGGFNLNTGKKRIEQSIFFILKTKIGERVFPPDFGSNLHRLVFEQNDLIFIDMAIMYTKEAIEKWEKRIKILNVQIKREAEIIDENRVDIVIEYLIQRTNVMGSYVYPFYITPMRVGGE